MTQVHFTLKSEEIQSIIEYSVKDDVSKNILTTVFNQLMENQRTEYIQAKEYERTENRQSQRNGYYERSFTTRVGTLELKVPRTRDGHFSPTVFERYQRNEKALMASLSSIDLTCLLVDPKKIWPRNLESLFLRRMIRQVPRY